MPHELELRADIPIDIRRNVIRITIADACIHAIIPIAARNQDSRISLVNLS